VFAGKDRRKELEPRALWSIPHRLMEKKGDARATEGHGPFGGGEWHREIRKEVLFPFFRRKEVPIKGRGKSGKIPYSLAYRSSITPFLTACVVGEEGV